MHAQIQQIEIYSPLNPPIHKSLFIYACTAIKVLQDKKIYEMNGILNLGYEIKLKQKFMASTWFALVPVRHSNLLSYESTDGGNPPYVGSNGQL